MENGTRLGAFITGGTDSSTTILYFSPSYPLPVNKSLYSSNTSICSIDMVLISFNKILMNLNR